MKAVMLIFLTLLMGSAVQQTEVPCPPSLADHLHLAHSNNPEDPNWLPDLDGLPDANQVALLTKHVDDVMAQNTENQCISINSFLKQMMFQHFVIYQQIANAQHVYFGDEIAYQWAHVLGMILKESGGDSTNITDMCGFSIATYQPAANLDHWKQILSLSAQGRVELTTQTNFGLTQTSPDRLFAAFHLAKDQQYNTEFLEGRAGAATPRKTPLNTAIAIRRLVWFYQGFAQGRITQSDELIAEQDINKPEYAERYRNGLKMTLLYCGTRFMFREDSYSTEPGSTTLEDAIASIAYCKLGNPENGYGVHEFDEKCFAQWVTLCPALNIDIATLTPLSYFATRSVGPVCEDIFRQLIIPNPAGPQSMGNTTPLQ